MTLYEVITSAVAILTIVISSLFAAASLRPKHRRWMKLVALKWAFRTLLLLDIGLSLFYVASFTLTSSAPTAAAIANFTLHAVNLCFLLAAAFVNATLDRLQHRNARLQMLEDRIAALEAPSKFGDARTSTTPQGH